MRYVDAKDMDFRQLNETLRAMDGDVTVQGCLGHRFIGAGKAQGTLILEGIPGNAAGCYLNGGTLKIMGNAQDAVGDTMNDGTIVIHGSVGDAAGYAMRGGSIFVQGDAGYRAGIHMKAFGDKIPAVVIGGRAGSFLGEYQAGGNIVVLGLGCRDDQLMGMFCGTGMHGGKIWFRAATPPDRFPPQCKLQREEDITPILPLLERFFGYFGGSLPEDGKVFWSLTPNSANPYKQMYCQN